MKDFASGFENMFKRFKFVNFNDVVKRLIHREMFTITNYRPDILSIDNQNRASE